MLLSPWPSWYPLQVGERHGETRVNGRREESKRAGGRSADEFGSQLRAVSTTGKAWVGRKGEVPSGLRYSLSP